MLMLTVYTQNQHREKRGQDIKRIHSWCNLWKPKWTNHLKEALVNLKKAYWGNLMFSTMYVWSQVGKTGSVSFLPSNEASSWLHEIWIWWFSLSVPKKVWISLMWYWGLAKRAEGSNKNNSNNTRLSSITSYHCQCFGGFSTSTAEYLTSLLGSRCGEVLRRMRKAVISSSLSIAQIL